MHILYGTVYTIYSFLNEGFKFFHFFVWRIPELFAMSVRKLKNVGSK